MPDQGTQAKEEISIAAANVMDALFRGGVADLDRTPASLVAEKRHMDVYRYGLPRGRPSNGKTVLLIPPLAVPATCYDLRKGCSMAAYLVDEGFDTFLVDFGEIDFGDRRLGLEFFVYEAIPYAVARALEESGAAEIDLVGWSLGGILSMLVTASGKSPVDRIAMIGSPFDFSKLKLIAPVRALAKVTHGQIVTALYRMMGGAPAGLVKRGFKLSGLQKYALKPLAIARNITNREFLAQIEAVDSFTEHMVAYPGRSFGQLYHQLVIDNDLKQGHITLAGHRELRLADVTAPVLAVAGTADTLAPAAAVEHVETLLPKSPEVRVEMAPGGHLGILTGRAARASTWKYISEFFSATT